MTRSRRETLNSVMNCQLRAQINFYRSWSSSWDNLHFQHDLSFLHWKNGCVQLRQTRLTLSYNSSLLCSSPSHEEGQRGVPHHSSTLFLPESQDSPHSDLLPLPYPLSHSLPFPFSSKSPARWHEGPWVSIDFGDVPHLTLPPCWRRRSWCGFPKAAAVWRQC